MKNNANNHENIGSEKKGTLKNTFLWVREQVKCNFKGMLTYRAAMILQIVGMMVNNTGILLVWYIFFRLFGSVNGWSYSEMLGLMGFVAIVFGIAFTLGKGMRRISRKVTYGQIDTFLVLPKSVLWQVIFSEVEVSAVGDFFFGVLLLVLYAVVSSFGIGQILLLPLLVVFGVCSMAGFTIVVQSLAFWFPNTEDLSNSLFEFMLGPSLYPNSSFTGGVRFFFVFVIPAIVIGGLPVDILLRLDLRDVLLLVGLSVFWLVAGIVVFYRGLRRYESGNLVGVR